MNSLLTVSVSLPEGFAAAPPTLALGGELKSSVCLIHDGVAHLSEPIGDLEQEEVYRHFCALVEQLLANSGKLEQMVVDLHPDYLSAQYGHRLAADLNLPVRSVQHHYAHIASVMADNGLPLNTKPVLGLALDGLGFGEDGTIWGGEMLLADYHGFRRVGYFQPVAMIGGAAAIHEPWRNTLAHLLPVWDEVSETFSDTDVVRFFDDKPVAMLKQMVASGMNAPRASSCGRLFDGVAAAVGLYREHVAFEAQAAIALEQAATLCFEQETSHYPYTMGEENGSLQLAWLPMWLELLSDIQKGCDVGVMAARFHRALIHALSESAVILCAKHGTNTIALSGGVFQNRLISTHLPQALKRAGITVLQHCRVPAHDGGICLGQAVVAAAKRLKDKVS